MNKLYSFLLKQQKYYIIYLAAAFVFFVVTYFVTQRSFQTISPLNDVAVASATSDGFTPDATNVSQSASQQLDALRLRVVNAPEDTTHVFRLARMLQDAHQLEEAARNYKHYLAMHPQNRQAWLDYAKCLGEMASWDDAKVAIEQMLSRYPDDPSGLYNLGAVYANQSALEKAKEIWNDVAAQETDLQVADMAKASLERLKSYVKPQWIESK